MNSSNIIVWYETGCCDEFHIPDPPYDTGVAVQREYIDVTDPDEGIFLERSYMSFSDDDPEREIVEKPQMSLYSRTLLVGPDELCSALSVAIHGVEVLRRDPVAGSRCGLAVTTQASLGFERGAANGTPEWVGEALGKALDKLHEMGEAGDAEIERRLDAHFAAADRKAG